MKPQILARWTIWLALLACLAASVNVGPAAGDNNPPVERLAIRLISERGGAWGNGDSFAAALSADGAVMVFQSRADNFDEDDPNTALDIYLTTLTGAPHLLSHGADGVADGESQSPAVSADGRVVVFESAAGNLTHGDDNHTWDIFAFDAVTEAVELVSRGLDGPANGPSSRAALSAAGRLVVFSSKADNLVANDTNGTADIFAYDRQTGQTTLVSLGMDGLPANHPSNNPAVSADGRLVVFDSWADNLVRGDTNYMSDVFLLDRQTGVMSRVNLTTTGDEADRPSQRPVISADGNVIAYESLATNLTPDDTNDTTDVFVYSRENGDVERVSVSTDNQTGNGPSGMAAISADGQLIVFASFADTLALDDDNHSLDIFLRARGQGITESISSRPGLLANGPSNNPEISADGRYITFDSVATNLIAGDTNTAIDIFLYDRGAVQTFGPRLYLPLLRHP